MVSLLVEIAEKPQLNVLTCRKCRAVAEAGAGKRPALWLLLAFLFPTAANVTDRADGPVPYSAHRRPVTVLLNEMPVQNLVV